MIKTLILTITIPILLFYSGCTVGTSPQDVSNLSDNTTTETQENDLEETTISANGEESIVADDSTLIEDDITTTPPPTEEDIEEKETLDTENVPLTIFSSSPINIENILSIVPLGNLNPPSHTFPTDHIYFYISRQEGGDRTQEVTLYSPGTLIVTRVNAIEHLQAGITDYSIELQKGENIHIRLGHVSSLSEDVFGDTTSFQAWEMTNEYSTGGETYRWWSKEYDIPVETGQVIGTAGGNPNQWALDLFLYDLEKTQQNIANTERWSQSWYLHAVDPLSYYELNPVFEQLLELVDREISEGEEPPYGSVLQDMSGTAQGCWFLEGITETYPEDPHLALVHDNIRPNIAVLSIGNSIRNLQSSTYEFLPQVSGLLNRDFKDISHDGNIYGFEVEGFTGVIIIHMPDSETLWVEALPGVDTEPTHWTFSIAKTIFKR